MRIGSLCSGAGGLDMAVERVFGAETVFHCEIDSAASRVLAYRWRGVPNYRDLIETDWAAVEPVDIVCAGWPCQPFSLAGKQKGADDERAIWPHIARAIRILRPRIVVLENVSAVLRSEFQRVADSLSSLGYDIRWTCLRASDVGAPHRRERLFVVAYAAGDGRYEGRPEPGWLGGRSDAAERGAADVADPSGSALLPTPTGRDHKGRNQRDDETCLTGALLPTPAAARSGRNQSPSPNAAVRPSLDMIDALLPTPQAADGARGQDYARANRIGSGGDDLVTLTVKAHNANQWGKYAPAVARWEQIAGTAPLPTEPNSKGNPRLNPAFSEWMMGWPAGHVTDLVPSPNLRIDPDIAISRNDALRIIGNGVCSQQAEVALRHLLGVTSPPMAARSTSMRRS